METRRLVPVGLAVAGFAVVVAGLYQELLHVAPGYEGQIMSGWGGALNHEEVLLARLAGVGLVGSVAASRWKYVSLVPVSMGGIVLFYAIRALGVTILDTPLYTETTTAGGDPIMFLLGAEPFLLVAGGCLLIGAGIVGWRQHATRPTGGEPAEPSTAV